MCIRCIIVPLFLSLFLWNAYGQYLKLIVPINHYVYSLTLLWNPRSDIRDQDKMMEGQWSDALAINNIRTILHWLKKLNINGTQTPREISDL